MPKNTNYTFLILFITICLNFNNLAKAEKADYKIIDSTKTPVILDMLASITRANFEKIKTWEGRGIYENINTIRGERAAEYLSKYSDAEPNELPDEIQRIINCTIEFKCDMESSRYFCLMDYLKPPAYQDSRNNATYLLDWGPGEIAFIDTPEHQIRISPESWSKDHVIKKKCARKQIAGTIDITDPRNVFNWGIRTLWLTLSLFSQSLQTSGIETYGIVLKENSAGDHIIYRLEISMPGKNWPFSILVFDSAAGFNPVYIENRYEEDGSLRSEKTVLFTAVQDVFLPARWEMSQYFPDGGLMRREICTIEEQQINAAIPDSTFSELTYLKEGDQIRDEIRNKRYTIQDGKIVEDTK